MNFEIKNGKVQGDIKDGWYEIKKTKKTRSLSQNSALHKWCELMSNELEEKHIDKREFFKEPFFLSWTPIGVKNDIWRPIQKSLTGKESTTKLARHGEIDLIWDNINNRIIEKYRGEVIVPEWPSVYTQFPLDNLK